ncbi:MAG TPA: DUF2127 domain-containing protein [Candidatus Didemnitutus sp.]|nr:DUF2127 domain-containing protein [Candidatus Didemnitutus sp.]
MKSIAHKALRPIAVFEAFKGFLGLVAGLSGLSLLGRDAEQIAEKLIVRMHLDPANHYMKAFVEWMSNVTDTQLWLLAGVAALYATVRFIEAYGLWFERKWAEWFAAFSGGVYIPIEVFELAKHPTWVRYSTLMLNLIVVAYMVWLLADSKRRQAEVVPPAEG